MAIRTRGFFDPGGGKDLEKWLCGMGGIEKKKASENTLLGIWLIDTSKATKARHAKCGQHKLGQGGYLKL